MAGREECYLPVSPPRPRVLTAKLCPLITLPLVAYAVLQVPSTLSANRGTWPDRTGKISGRARLAGDGETSYGRGSHMSARWWARPSPWLWGLVALLAIAGLAVMQEPRLRVACSARESKPGPAGATAPTLSGLVYTPAMVADCNFKGADLSGARLVHLDLRGKDFQDANATGAMFTDSLLSGVNLSHANLRGADLRGTCLRGANLTGTKLAGANFTDAEVTGVTISPGAVSDAIGWTLTSDSLACSPG